MNETDTHDWLQERLARIEAGETLEAVLADLPAEEAGLVQLAAALKSVAYPGREASLVSAQRRELLRAAQKGKTMTIQPDPADAGGTRTRWGLRLTLLGGLAALFVCAFAVATLAGAVWWWRGGRLSEAQRGPTGGEVVVEARDPQSGAVSEARGLVEAQGDDGSWEVVRAGHVVTAGQRLRTGTLSSATLVFYDGSQTRLEPNTEITVEALDAQKSGPRVVRLTQWLGDTDHDVAPSSDPASVYEVNTPSGAGRAKGTFFHVSVTTVLIRFDVDEGAVEVTNVNVTVVVVAGQSTVIVVGQPPVTPMFRITGEGEVERTGATWRIAGQDFLTNENTVIVGNPQVGDWVAFEGRLFAGGTRYADRIVLLRRALEGRFTFAGTVEATGVLTWTISGRTVHVDDRTTIESGLGVGDEVEVEGGVTLDGTLWASSIRRAATNRFQFTGVVQRMGAGSWTISGISVTVNVSTTIDAEIVAGDVVLVRGQILEDDTWLATSIQRTTADMFDFVGVVVRTNPWNVSGVEFETDEHTDIDEGIRVGNRVRVRGRILADGTWLAERIMQLDEDRRHHVQFTARVQSIDPWVVGGISVTVDAQTQIEGVIEVDDLVTVKGNLLPDGTVLAKKITRVAEARSCADTSVIVSSVGDGQIVLLDGRTISLTESVNVEGTINIASVIVIRTCVGEGDQLVVVSIVVVFQLEGLPTPTPTPVTPSPAGDTSGEFTICHQPPGNPEQRHTIKVDGGALQGHLGHGDTLGPCGGDGEGDDDDD